MNKRVHRTIGNRDIHFAAPYGVYRCFGEDRWVTLSVSSDEEWGGLCRALDNPPWTKEERFADPISRWKNQDELDKLIEEWTLQHDHFAVMYILQKEGVPAGAVLDAVDTYHDPQLNARGFFEVIHHREAGTHVYPGLQWKYSKTPMRIRNAPPCMGEHNDYVFKELLKMSDEEITELEKDNFIIGGDGWAF